MSAAPPFDLERARLTAGAHLRPEHFDEFQRLAKTLLHGPAFQLLFIECADAGYRKRVMAAIDALLHGAKLRTSRLPIGARMADVPTLEARLRRHAAAAEVVHVLGGTRWFDAARWDDLNQRRERLARDARARLVFWLDAVSIASLASHAQDLWAWRSGVYAFVTAGARVAFEFPMAAVPSATYSQDIDTRSMVQRYRRIAELKRMLAADPPDDLLGPLLDELGRLLYHTGQYGDALAHWHDVERPFHLRRKDEREVAITSGKIADLLMVRGELDEVLRIRRERAG